MTTSRKCLGRSGMGETACTAPVRYMVFSYTQVWDTCGLHMPQIIRWAFRKDAADTVTVKQLQKENSHE